MIETLSVAQNKYLIPKTLLQKPELAKKELGQYFTNPAIAFYMAEMIQPVNTSVVRILDAGAGTGVLTFFSAIRCLKLGHKKVHAILYEIDKDILSILTMNMNYLSDVFRKQGCKLTFEIHNKDFILARPDRTEKNIHISSINPPYFKYNSKTSIYGGATTDLYKGNPNVYASFMAIVVTCLAPNGQMIAIVPRSFTNGLYFKGFRHYMNQIMSLNKIHIFKTRNRIFKESSVLQENIICYYTKCNQKSQIEVYTSTDHKDLKQLEKKQYSTKQIIDKSTKYEIIRIPETSEDAKILETVEKWPTRFEENGYFISTGPIVEHRTRKYITYSNSNEKINSVPLLKMHNIKAFQIDWTGYHKKDARFKLIEGHDKYTFNNQIYVILKRFSAKDEKRRLIAAIHNPKLIKSHLIAMENHLNYIWRKDSHLNLTEAYGLVILFNSTFMDKYFRCLSGNTQVNATEIRLLKMPNRQTIHQIGCFFLKNMTNNQSKVDDIINFCLKGTKFV